MHERHLIIIKEDERGTWRFAYHGRLRWWQKMCIRMAGWEIRKAS